MTVLTSKSLNNKTALITGGGTGIGFGCARSLAENGVRVTIFGRRHDVLEAAVERLQQAVPDASVAMICGDATEEEQLSEAVSIAGGNDPLDIMVANAGSAVPGPVLELDANAWHAAVDMNILTSALCIKCAGQAMRHNSEGGCIITVSSTAAVQVEKWMSTYSATKAAVEMLSRCAALELAPLKIRVNCIQPGYIQTEATEQYFHPDFAQRLKKATPMGCAGMPEHIGEALIFLASDSGRWTTGQIIGIDGGLNIPQGADFIEMMRDMYGNELMDGYLNKKTS